MKEQDFTLTPLQVNLLAIPVTISQMLIFSGGLFLTLGGEAWTEGLRAPVLKIQYFLTILIVGSFMHEVLHFIGFNIWKDVQFSDLKLGIVWKTVTPYAHCKKAVKVNVYRFSLMLPFLILGLIPVIISYIYGLVWLNIFGTIFCLLAGGDLIVFWLIKNVRSDQLLLDHPELCGCQVTE